MVRSIDLTVDATLRDKVRRRFYEEGSCIVEWARSNGFSPDLVYAVLSGRSPAQRGASHRIAVALGLKPALPTLFGPGAMTQEPSRPENTDEAGSSSAIQEMHMET